MKTKILTLLVAMLLTTTLTACSGSKKDNKTETNTNSVTTVEPVVTATPETADSNKTEDDFIAMAKDMYMQYHDSEKDFNELLKGTYETTSYIRWIGDSSYCIQEFSMVNYDGSTSHVGSNERYTESKNGRDFNEYVNEQAEAYGAISDITIKTINGLQIAHFTCESEYDENADGIYNYFYDEFYIVNDLKDDKFLAIVFEYDNKKKNNDNSDNPKQMNSDHSNYFLSTAATIQTIQEVEKHEIEIYDYDNNESSGIAFNTFVIGCDEDFFEYEKNIPIEGSDDYKVISGYALNEDFSIGNTRSIGVYKDEVYKVDPYDHFMFTASIISPSYVEDMTLLEYAQKMQNDFLGYLGSYDNATLEEININGVQGYLVKLNKTNDDGLGTYYYDDYRYYFENNGKYIEISFDSWYSNEIIGNSNAAQRESIINSIHVVEK